jgi:3D (Asp-Asp-Asp) domain-containing protein
VFSKHKKTSTGVDARKPIGVAAAPTFVPYGSQVFIPGLATNALRIVDDTGGGMRRHARKGGVQFDVRFTTHQQAKKFGVRYTNVFIVLEDPTPEQIARFEKMAIFSHETEAMSQTEAIQITEQQFALAE